MQDSFNNVNWDDKLQEPKEKDFENEPTIFPPSLYFTLSNKTRVFIIPGDSALRKGILRHALKPYQKVDMHKRTYPQKMIDEPDRDKVKDEDYDNKYCKKGRDYVTPDDDQKYYEIGLDFLKELCMQAEQRDREFSMTIQGLLGVAQNYVWACMDPDFDPHDRLPLWHLYVKTKLEQALDSVKQDQSANEILRQHKVFCKEWVHKHYKNITPIVMSASIVVINKCLNIIPRKFQGLSNLTLARMMWRNDQTHGLFAECIYWQITSNDQSKGGRNPSYKQMNVVSHAHAQCYYKLVKVLGEINWEKTWFRSPDDCSVVQVHPDSIDWHGIVGQIPDVHAMFAGLEDVKDEEEEMENDPNNFFPRWQ